MTTKELAIRELKEAVSDDIHYEVRIEAVEGLVALNDKRVIYYLLKVLRNSQTYSGTCEQYVRKAIIKGIVKLLEA